MGRIDAVGDVLAVHQSSEGVVRKAVDVRLEVPGGVGRRDAHPWRELRECDWIAKTGAPLRQGKQVDSISGDIEALLRAFGFEQRRISSYRDGFGGRAELQNDIDALGRRNLNANALLNVFAESGCCYGQLIVTRRQGGECVITRLRSFRLIGRSGFRIP